MNSIQFSHTTAEDESRATPIKPLITIAPKGTEKPLPTPALTSISETSSSYKSPMSPILDAYVYEADRAKRDKSSRNAIPRPSNSFILYRREKHAEIMAQYKGAKALNNNVISKIVASMWKQESSEIKSFYSGKAEEEKRLHMLKYPDYKYRPRKNSSKGKNGLSPKPSPLSIMGQSSFSGLLPISRNPNSTLGSPMSAGSDMSYSLSAMTPWSSNGAYSFMNDGYFYPGYPDRRVSDELSKYYQGESGGSMHEHRPYQQEYHETNAPPPFAYWQQPTDLQWDNVSLELKPLGSASTDSLPGSPASAKRPSQ